MGWRALRALVPLGLMMGGSSTLMGGFAIVLYASPERTVLAAFVGGAILGISATCFWLLHGWVIGGVDRVEPLGLEDTRSKLVAHLTRRSES